MTQFLISTFGKERLFKLLKDLQPKENYQDFADKFQKHFGISLDQAKANWITRDTQTGKLT